MSSPPRRAIRWLAALALAALGGCQPEAPIRIGFIGGSAGHVSDLAIDGRNGVQLAVETLNAQGGPHYALMVHDDEQSAQNAARADIDAAAAEGDAFAIGPMTSVLAQQLVAEANLRRLVLISPTANSDTLAGIDDYFFRVNPGARLGAERFAHAALARGLTTAAVMTDWSNRTYTEGFAQVFQQEFQAHGGGGVATVHYESGRQPDYALVAAQLLAARPRFVLLVCGAADAAIVSQQLRKRDARVQLAVASWAANAQLLQLGGRAMEGALALQALDLDSRAPAYLDFMRRYEARYGAVAGQAAAYAYTAAMVGAEALRRRRGGQSLRDVLRAPGRWDGLQEPVLLDRFGDSNTGFHLSEVRNGRFVMLPP